jgi:hypothetical protein
MESAPANTLFFDGIFKAYSPPPHSLQSVKPTFFSALCLSAEKMLKKTHLPLLPFGESDINSAGSIDCSIHMEGKYFRAPLVNNHAK